MINPRIYQLNNDWHLSLLRNNEGWLATFTCPIDSVAIDVSVPETELLALEPVSFPDILVVCPFCLAQGRIIDGAWVPE